jgi:hypothetical protein
MLRLAGLTHRFFLSVVFWGVILRCVRLFLLAPRDGAGRKQDRGHYQSRILHYHFLFCLTPAGKVLFSTADPFNWMQV